MIETSGLRTKRTTMRRLKSGLVFSTCLASHEEKQRAMPADSLVLAPKGIVTHAITINAPPERVGPWLAQMGAGRAGWYSYDWIDNGGHPSASSIRPGNSTLSRET